MFLLPVNAVPIFFLLKQRLAIPTSLLKQRCLATLPLESL